MQDVEAVFCRAAGKWGGRFIPFSSLAKLKEFAKEHTIEILLIDRGALRETEGIRARQVITLADGEVVELAGGMSGGL